LKALNIKSVGLPYQIGCELGGGDWTAYFEIIQTTAKFVFPSARRVESISPQGYFPVICLDNPCGLTQTQFT
jgi:hypothetical protein